MSRRRVKRRKTLRQCGGDVKRFNATRPSAKVVGTGKWLGTGLGKGATVTLPEKHTKNL